MSFWWFYTSQALGHYLRSWLVPQGQSNISLCIISMNKTKLFLALGVGVSHPWSKPSLSELDIHGDRWPVGTDTPQHSALTPHLEGAWPLSDTKIPNPKFKQTRDPPPNKPEKNPTFKVYIFPTALWLIWNMIFVELQMWKCKKKWINIHQTGFCAKLGCMAGMDKLISAWTVLEHIHIPRACKCEVTMLQLTPALI